VSAFTRFLRTTAVLMAGWVILSQVFDAFHLGLGIVSSLALAAIRARSRPARSFPAGRFLAYVPWLLGQVFVSNLRVARLALSPRPRLSPRLLRIPAGVTGRPALTLLGCSITLTPGTVTVDASAEGLVVHALDADSARDIERQILARRVQAVFEDRGE
jgi:multicomponent Na+:H+ antiporter subunit E